MRLLAASGCFVSTWALESWGITALEALNHGIPTILLTGTDGKHASELIAANSDHVVKLTKSTPVATVEAVIRELNQISHQERLEIAAATKKKHSRQQWVDRITTIFDIPITTTYNPFKNDLFSF